MKPDKPLFPPMPPMTDEEAAIAKQQNHWRNRSTSYHRTIIELVVLFTVIIGVAIGYYRETRLPFNSEQWKLAGTFYNRGGPKLSVRKRMCDDLIRNKKLMGLHRSQVIALLGEPASSGLELSYLVGPTITISSDYLVIELDRQNKVTDYYVRTIG